MAHHIHLPSVSILLILLFHSTPTTAANSVVLDVEGNPLEAGSPYYVLTTGRGAAGRGGITFASRPDHLCPTYVGQYSWWTERGRPISFHPADTSQKEITEGVDVNIAFGGGNYCRDLGVWQLTIDEATNVPYVSTNGVFGNSGVGTGSNWFKIEETNSGIGYRIVYCYMDDNCQQLGVTEPGLEGFSWLTLVPIDKPLPFFGFAFRKATTSNYY